MSGGAQVSPQDMAGILSGSLKGSQAMESEEEASVLPAGPTGPDHWHLQILHVKLLTWRPAELQGVHFCSEKTALIGNSS